MVQNTSYNLSVQFFLGCNFPRPPSILLSKVNWLFSKPIIQKSAKLFLHWTGHCLLLFCTGFYFLNPLLHLYWFIFLFWQRTSCSSFLKKGAGVSFVTLYVRAVSVLPSDLIPNWVRYRIVHWKLVFFRISKASFHWIVAFRVAAEVWCHLLPVFAHNSFSLWESFI